VIDEDQKTIRGIVFLRRRTEFTSNAILKFVDDDLPPRSSLSLM
jgi:hypothetical protein